jgi:hypothetical protein
LSQALPSLGPEFEPFLYAIVCDEAPGAPLTMVSAIARSGAEPWQEAARIARLPKSAAFEALLRLIPDRGDAENKAIAKRLFALLPAHEYKNIPFVGAKANAPKANALRWSPLVTAILLLLLGLALVSAFRTTPHRDAGRHEMPSSAPMADKADP